MTSTSFFYRWHKSGSDALLAVADSQLVGKELAEGSERLNVSHDFYGEESADAESILTYAKSATIVNALGDDAVNLLVSKGLVKKEETIRICGILHAQIFVA